MAKPIKISGGGPSTLGCAVVLVLGFLGALSVLWPLAQAVS